MGYLKKMKDGKTDLQKLIMADPLLQEATQIAFIKGVTRDELVQIINEGTSKLLEEKQGIGRHVKPTKGR